MDGFYFIFFRQSFITLDVQFTLVKTTKPAVEYAEKQDKVSWGFKGNMVSYLQNYINIITVSYN